MLACLCHHDLRYATDGHDGAASNVGISVLFAMKRAICRSDDPGMATALITPGLKLLGWQSFVKTKGSTTACVHHMPKNYFPKHLVNMRHWSGP